MADTIQETLRKDTTAGRLAMIPAEGEHVYDTDLKRSFMGDGVTAGGKLIGLPPKALTALSDAAATLTAAQLEGGLFTINPTAARILTTDTAANIIADMPLSANDESFEFTVINLDAFDVTIAAGTGVTLVGEMGINNGSSTFIVRRLTSTTVAIYRKGDVGGKVLQVRHFSTTTTTASTSGTYANSAVTETITPHSTSNKILVMVSTNVRLYETAGADSEANINIVGTASGEITSAVIKGYDYGSSGLQLIGNESMSSLDAPASISPQTYTVQLKLNSGDQVTINSASVSTITLMEIEG